MKTYEEQAERRITYYLIIASACIALILAGFGYVYLNKTQEWVSKTIIIIDNKDASRGYAMDGSRTEDVINEIKSTAVITRAAELIGDEKITPNQIASSLEVEGVVPELEVERKDSAMKNGLDYEFFPTEYEITYTIKENRDVQRELSAVLTAFFEHFAEKHITDERIPANSMVALTPSIEPYSAVDQISTHVNAMILFLTEQAEKYPNYRSDATGRSYMDLLNKYGSIRDWNVSELMSTVLTAKLSKNPQALVDQFQKTIQLNNDLILDLEGDMKETEDLMLSYSEKNKIKGSWTKFESDVDNQVDLNHDNIMQELYENPVRPRTAYDQVMDKYIIEGDEIGMRRQENIYLEHLISIFSNANPSDEMDLHFIQMRVAELKAELIELYKSVYATEMEHIEVRSSDNIRIQTTPTENHKYRTKLYTLILAVGGFSLSMIGLFWLRSIIKDLKKDDGEDVIDDVTLGAVPSDEPPKLTDQVLGRKPLV